MTARAMTTLRRQVRATLILAGFTPGRRHGGGRSVKHGRSVAGITEGFRLSDAGGWVVVRHLRYQRFGQQPRDVLMAANYRRALADAGFHVGDPHVGGTPDPAAVYVDAAPGTWEPGPPARLKEHTP